MAILGAVVVVAPRATGSSTALGPNLVVRCWRVHVSLPVFKSVSHGSRRHSTLATPRQTATATQGGRRRAVAAGDCARLHVDQLGQNARRAAKSAGGSASPVQARRSAPQRSH